MREIDLSPYKIRTDLVTDLKEIKDISGITEKTYEEGKVKVSNIQIENNAGKSINKSDGFYTTIFFNDITDTDNFNEVLKIFTNELKSLLEVIPLKKDYEVLVIGLGNEKVTPDALGPKTIENINATRHIYELTGALEKNFRIISKITPNVMGTTGI